MQPAGDLAHTPGMCPDRESNWQPFSSQASAPSTEPHQPGLVFPLKSVRLLFSFQLGEWLCCSPCSSNPNLEVAVTPQPAPAVWEILKSAWSCTWNSPAWLHAPGHHLVPASVFSHLFWFTNSLLTTFPSFILTPLSISHTTARATVYGKGVQPAAHGLHVAQDGYECGPTRHRTFT